MKILAASGELLRGRVFEVPQLVFHSAVEFLRILLPLHVELDADRRVHAHREVIVDDVVRYAVLVRFLLFLLIQDLDLPAVHHHGRRFFYLLRIENTETVGPRPLLRGSLVARAPIIRKSRYLEDFVYSFTFVTTAPSQTPCEIIARAQRYNTHRWLVFELDAIWGFTNGTPVVNQPPDPTLRYQIHVHSYP